MVPLLATSPVLAEGTAAIDGKVCCLRHGCPIFGSVPAFRETPSLEGINLVTQIDRDGNRILLAILAELEVFSTIDLALFQASHPYVWTMQQLGIPYRPAAWFRGPLSGSRRKAISQATMKLAREGLVERITETRRDRVTHLRFRRTGFRQALKLANPKVNWPQLLESLAQIDWGDDLWHELDPYPLAIEVMTVSEL